SGVADEGEAERREIAVAHVSVEDRAPRLLHRLAHVLDREEALVEVPGELRRGGVGDEEVVGEVRVHPTREERRGEPVAPGPTEHDPPTWGRPAPLAARVEDHERRGAPLEREHVLVDEGPIVQDERYVGRLRWIELAVAGEM